MAKMPCIFLVIVILNFVFYLQIRVLSFCCINSYAVSNLCKNLVCKLFIEIHIARKLGLLLSVLISHNIESLFMMNFM